MKNVSYQHPRPELEKHNVIGLYQSKTQVKFRSYLTAISGSYLAVLTTINKAEMKMKPNNFFKKKT